ncbi:chitinase-3-like protein 1 [Folsomia candida]|uniref:Chitotriosidase-1 n=1 Tax=Folsomia candida TaxID=158441 RepID=A0A226EFM7_FOLCA|nr:chitinase-3-like protein 1 [Folsomia candida]OXA56385.1 Chitotriosidase-1 [Folsomia candida]
MSFCRGGLYFLGVFVLQFLSLNVAAQESNVLVCYYNSESYYRPELPFEPANINATLCTHVIYSYLGMGAEIYNVYSRNPGLDLGPGETEPFPDDPDNSIGELDFIRKTVVLRQDNPAVKVLVSIGGPLQSSRSFSNMARHVANRTLFIRSLIKYVDLYELDGIDLYWKYPGNGDGRPEDGESFVYVMRDLRAAFTNLTTFTGRNYTLTGTLGCTKNVIDAGYDVTGLAQYVDFLNLLCFDFKMYTDSTSNIAHHSPLFHKESDSDPDKQLTAAYGVDYFLSKNATSVSRKLVLGISAHGRTYELGAPDYNNFGQPTMGLGPPGSFTRQQGILSFYEICHEVNKSTSAWQFRYDHDYRIPYICNDIMWIGYDNEISVKEKIDFAIGTKNLGGIAIDFIDYDDFSNLCKSWVSYPLASAIKERLNYWEINKKR